MEADDTRLSYEGEGLVFRFNLILELAQMLATIVDCRDRRCG